MQKESKTEEELLYKLMKEGNSHSRHSRTNIAFFNIMSVWININIGVDMDCGAVVLHTNGSGLVQQRRSITGNGDT